MTWTHVDDFKIICFISCEICASLLVLFESSTTFCFEIYILSFTKKPTPRSTILVYGLSLESMLLSVLFKFFSWLLRETLHQPAAVAHVESTDSCYVGHANRQLQNILCQPETIMTDDWPLLILDTSTCRFKLGSVGQKTVILWCRMFQSTNVTSGLCRPKFVIQAVLIDSF